MTPFVGWIVKATFSIIVRYFSTFPHPQANQPERQQSAQFCATIGGRHKARVEGIWSFHI
jgi:hypothetical protein